MLSKSQAKLFNTWHKKKSWAETTKTTGDYPYISYHDLMATNGDILKVTDDKWVKYHAGDNFRGKDSFNLHGKSICLTGNYENDKPTPEMELALVQYIRDYEKKKNINARVRGHKETSEKATACPGKNIGTSKIGWLKEIIAKCNDKDYPPEPQSNEPSCEELLSITETENTQLKTSLSNAEGIIKDRDDTILGLEETYKSDIKELEDNLKTANDQYATLIIKYKTLMNTNVGIVQELNKLKGSRFIWIVNFLEKVFTRV